SRFTAHEAYDFAEEPDYQKWADALTAAAIDAARNARETPDYPAFRAAVDRAAATCSDCHGVYR
ncbi:MAG: cytochrome c, partial [Planctomycetota bacterium]